MGFFALEVSLNKLLLLKSNLKPFLKDTGIPKGVPMFLTLVLTQTCYDAVKFYVSAKNPWYVKNKIIAEVNLKHLVWKIVLMVGRAIVSLERSKRIVEMKFLISPFWPLSKQFQFLPHVSKIYFALVIKTHIQFLHCTTTQVETYLGDFQEFQEIWKNSEKS